MVTPLQTPNPYALEALPQEILNRVLVAMPVPDLISWGCGSPPLQRILSTAFRTLFAARCEWPLEFAHGPPLQRLSMLSPAIAWGAVGPRLQPKGASVTLRSRPAPGDSWPPSSSCVAFADGVLHLQEDGSQSMAIEILETVAWEELSGQGNLGNPAWLSLGVTSATTAESHQVLQSQTSASERVNICVYITHDALGHTVLRRLGHSWMLTGYGNFYIHGEADFSLSDEELWDAQTSVVAGSVVQLRARANGSLCLLVDGEIHTDLPNAAVDVSKPLHGFVVLGFPATALRLIKPIF